MLDLSIVTINYNTKDLTLNCIKSVIKYTKGIKYEIIVVDNASSEEFSLEGLPAKLIKSKKNLGFTGGNNLGIRAAKGRYVLLLNSDTYLEEDTLSEMVAFMDEHSDVGIATSAVKNVDGTPQTTGGHFPTLTRVLFWQILQDFPLMEGVVSQFHPKMNKKTVHELDWVGGHMFMIKREVINNVGLLDDDYFMYTEEVDYCFRAKEKGWKIFFVPVGTITHIGGASSGSEFIVLSEIRGVKMFFKKHYDSWQYPLLRLILKIGALGRIVLFGILKGGGMAKIYAKAFWQA